MIKNRSPDTFDFDDDGKLDIYKPDRIVSCGDSQPLTFAPPTDLCTLSSDESDEDGDGLYGECDPDPFFRNQYVAGGSNTWKAYKSSEIVLSSHSVWQTSVGPHPRGGFWDSDQDGHVEGEDLCPTIPGGGALGDPYSNRNMWGEELTFQQVDGTRDVGFLNRGDICDPYPSTSTRWTDTGSPVEDSICEPFPRVRRAGANQYKLNVHVQAGRSANDPNRDAPDNREFLVQPHRCACPSGNTENCLESDSSPCFSDRLQEADELTPSGASWRPIYRSDCLKDSDGYCEPLTLPNPSIAEVSWDWVQEYLEYPNHFPANSVTEEPARAPFPPFALTGDTEYSAGPYAIWTLAAEGASFTQAPGLAFNSPAGARFPEPERTNYGAVLADITSPESRSLRSSFAAPVSLHSRHTRMLPPGNLCAPPALIDPCAQAACEWSSWWNWVVFPPDISEVGGGLFQDWQLADAWFWQQRGDRLVDVYFGIQGLSDLRAALEEPGHWAESALGHIAVLNAGQAAPAAMVLEHSTNQARWALFEAVAQDANQLAFSPIAEGQLPSAITEQARLISDPRGREVVLIDPELNAFYSFDWVLNEWLPQTLEGVEMSSLMVSASSLSGSRLFVAPSANSAGLVVDIYSGKTAQWALPGLARNGARLSPSFDGGGLLLSGGWDQAGYHDDVWFIAFGEGNSPSITRLVADSAAPSPWHASRALLGYSDGAPILSVASGSQGSGLNIWQSAGAEWPRAACLAGDLANLAAFSSSQLWLGAGARLVGLDNYASAASLGEARIGIGAQLGSFSTQAHLSVGLGAQLAGDAMASGGILNHGQVAGQVQANLPIELSGLGCFQPTLPPAAGSVNGLPLSTKALNPGSYTNIKLLPHATLKLRTGTYYMKRFEALPLSKIKLDTSQGPIRILVQSELNLLGDWIAEPEAAENLLLAYLGSNALTWVRPFKGTLIAPQAALSLGNWEADAFNGAFFAKELNILPGVEIQHRAFKGELLP